MNKKGQIFEIVGVLIIIGIAIYGVSQVYYLKDKVYVGNNLNSKAYSYNECKNFINSLPQDRIVVFASKEDAVKQGFKIGECK